MAYMNQERKARIVAAVKPVMQKYGLKGTFSVRSHSTICLNITSGPIDFVENYIQTDAALPHANHMSQDSIARLRESQSIDVNPYWYQNHFSGTALKAIKDILKGMYSADYYDHSDAQTDYFNTAYYIDLNIGKWDKPYHCA
jgi:hypothetical protein